MNTSVGGAHQKLAALPGVRPARRLVSPGSAEEFDPNQSSWAIHASTPFRLHQNNFTATRHVDQRRAMVAYMYLRISAGQRHNSRLCGW
jgi:hypothetical protein